MGGFNIGGFAQGLTGGLQAAGGLREQAMRLKQVQAALDQQKAALAQRAMAGGFTGVPDGDQGGAPGTPPPTIPGAPGGPQANSGFAGPTPPQGGPPAPAPMPGATPMPQGAAPPPGGPPGPGGVQGIPPGGGMQGMPPGAAPPGTQYMRSVQGSPPDGPPASPIGARAAGALGDAPQVQPNGPAPPPSGLSGTAQGQQDPFKKMQQNTQSLLGALRKQYPNARPADILGAADQYISLMKGVDQSDKDLMKIQVEYFKNLNDALTKKDIAAGHDQTSSANNQRNSQTSTDNNQRNNDTRQEEGAANRQNRTDIDSANNQTRREEGDANRQNRTDISGANNQTRRYGIDSANARAAGGGAGGNLKIEKQIDGTVVGKNYHTVSTAADNIKALAKEPNITSDPAAQQGMIDAFVRMMTARGATKAQYDQFAKRMGFADWVSVTSNIAGGHPIIGPRQIQTLVDAADREEKGARATAMADPAVGPALRQMEGGQGSGAGGGAPRYTPGMVRGGYRFKGGDPTQKENWTKVGG